MNAHSLFSKWFSESGKLVSRLFAKIQVSQIHLCSKHDSNAWSNETVSTQLVLQLMPLQVAHLDLAGQVLAAYGHALLKLL